ncbi:hypothetical protein MKZ38_001134 [Zalerion maritima]|uniref:Uncharacterized protein n=1 Tax=Zalerion maritima TaxID=339359 RepID=A0AAD5WTA7_9PEZI|nr:hypothetical protein MKZ38_001134 [Zalerion maritima]
MKNLFTLLEIKSEYAYQLDHDDFLDTINHAHELTTEESAHNPATTWRKTILTHLALYFRVSISQSKPFFSFWPEKRKRRGKRQNVVKFWRRHAEAFYVEVLAQSGRKIKPLEANQVLYNLSGLCDKGTNLTTENQQDCRDFLEMLLETMNTSQTNRDLHKTAHTKIEPSHGPPPSATHKAQPSTPQVNIS